MLPLANPATAAAFRLLAWSLSTLFLLLPGRNLSIIWSGRFRSCVTNVTVEVHRLSLLITVALVSSRLTWQPLRFVADGQLLSNLREN